MASTKILQKISISNSTGAVTIGVEIQQGRTPPAFFQKVLIILLCKKSNMMDAMDSQSIGFFQTCFKVVAYTYSSRGHHVRIQDTQQI